MPFTFVHPAIFLPIKSKLEKYFDLTGLVVGSMAPDFEYFIRFKPVAVIGHTMTGFILLNLPLCFVIAFLYHKIIKKPLILSLPSPLDRWYTYIALKDWKIRPFKLMVVFMYSSLIGMASHVHWDAFTHEKGRFVVLLPVLTEKLNILNWSFPIYKLLQHGSTLLAGMTIVIYIYLKRDKTEGVSTPSVYKKLFYFTFIFFTGMAFVFTGIWISFINLSHNSIGAAVVTFINGIFLGTLLMSILYRNYGKVTGIQR